MDVLRSSSVHHGSSKSETICKFWAVGKCTRGVHCPYLHSWQGASDGCAAMTAEVVPTVIPVTWLPPPPDWIKINTDGAVRGSTGASSCGGVFRDCTGSVLGAFRSFLGNGLTPLEAEMHGVMRAVDIVSTYGLKKIWLESDSSQTVCLLKGRVTDVPDFMRDDWCKMLKQIKDMELVVSHIYREGNTVADKLANHGIESRDSFTPWNEAPDFILDEAQLDASGHTYLRFKA